MLKNITLSAEKGLILRGRERASQERRSLNSAFRQWLQKYASGGGSENDYEEVMARLSHISAGQAFSREELNER